MELHKYRVTYWSFIEWQEIKYITIAESEPSVREAADAECPERFRLSRLSRDTLTITDLGEISLPYVIC